MPLCALPDRTVIAVSGADASHFLQNLVTANLETLEPGIVSACALLSPQGKVMFDFLISKQAENRFWLELRSDLASDFIKRLTLYKLRAAVEITVEEQVFVAASWYVDSTASEIDSYVDRRFGDAGVLRHYTDQQLQGDRDYDALRVAHGVVESGADFALGEVFGHDISLDQNGGVDFRKGCYVGQEVVSRMHHRKTARRRVVIVEGNALAPEATIMADGKPAGTMGTVADTKGLAIVRLDRVKEALDADAPVTVDNQAVQVMLPPKVSYDWPSTETNDA
ncbi:MAG: folate-binding protein [Ahrensia sp.]